MGERKDVKTAYEDSENLIELAEIAERRNFPNRIIGALYIRSMIRGNDALCLKYLKEKPSRHHEATKYFAKLYEENHINEKYSKYKNKISDAVNQKTDLEYKPETLSKNQLKKLKKRAQRFQEKPVKQNLET